MAFHDLLADGQPNAGTRKLFSLMQPLEHSKDPLEVLRFDTEPIVSNGKLSSLAPVLERRNAYSGSAALLVLDGVPNKVLE